MLAIRVAHCYNVMKILIEIAPDDTLKEEDLAEMRRRAAMAGKKTGEWAAGVILRELNNPPERPLLQETRAIAA